MKRNVFVLGFLLVVLVLSGGGYDPAIAQDQDMPTVQTEMTVLIEWPTICLTDGESEWERFALVTVSCGEQATYTTRFLGACSADPNDTPGTMAAMSTTIDQIPLETFACE